MRITIEWSGTASEQISSEIPLPEVGQSCDLLGAGTVVVEAERLTPRRARLVLRVAADMPFSGQLRSLPGLELRSVEPVTLVTQPAPAKARRRLFRRRGPR